MAIKQIIKYNSPNKYFAGFLNHIIEETGIKGSVTFKKDEIILLLDDKDEKKLESFSQMTSKYLPHSIFLGDIQTECVDEVISNKPFSSPAYEIGLCNKCIEAISNPSSEQYLDDSIRCMHYSNSEIIDKQDTIMYSPHYTPNTTLLLCDATKVNDLFIITQEEIKILFSIEKPTIKATIKDEGLKKLTNKKYINIKSPYNIKSTLTAINAKDSDIDYLFFQDTQTSKAVAIQKNISLIKDTRVTSKLEHFADDKELNRFLNIAQEMGNKERAIGAYLSVKNGISFMASTQGGAKKVLSFQEFDLKQLLENMQNDKQKSKLLNNFKDKYNDIINKLLENPSFDMYETLSVILELDEYGFEPLSDKSLEFRGNGGLKIDMNFNNKGFDFVSFFGSIMSFKLANTDTHYLAYSVFEAFGDMAISTLNQLKTKLKIDNFIIMGDMFDNTILYSRILSKFGTNKPFFSKYYALDD